MRRRNEIEQEEWLLKLQRHVEANIGNGKFTVTDLARLMYCSNRQLRRKLNEYTGQSPSEYLIEARLQKAHSYLKQKTFPTIVSTALAVGYKDSMHFTQIFRERFGVLPSEL